MINTELEAYKLKRELKRSGVDYEFRRLERNEFDEPTKSEFSVGFIRGLYHEQNGNIQITMSDTTQVRTKKFPMILCLYDDVASLDLRVGDIVKINSKTFKFIGMVNVQEWNIVADISLEVVDNGF